MFSLFKVNAQVRIVADDAIGRDNLARYLIRAPFSMDKIRYATAAQTVICKTKLVERPNRNFEISDPLAGPDCGGAMRIIALVED